MNEWLDDFKTAVAFLTRLPMPHPEGATPTEFRARAPDVSGGRRADRRRGGTALPRLALRRRAGSCGGGVGAWRQCDPDRRAARGWSGRRRRRIWWRPESGVEAGDHARQPARHLWRRGPAGEFCREDFRAGGDPGRLCRPEPDRRARAVARRIACHVDEPSLCAQGRVGPQCRPARCGDVGNGWRARVGHRAAVAVMDQCAVRRACGGRERARYGAAGDAANRRPDRRCAGRRRAGLRRPRSLFCSQQGWRSRDARRRICG